MAKKNIFISHRWDYVDDYNKISAALDRSKYDVSDRSVESADPLVGTKKAVTDAIKGKIDSASVVLAPARPAAVTVGSMGRKEIDYAVSKSKAIIAVDTGATDSVAAYWGEKGIPVVACRKDSIENEIG
jgi:phosphohistidine swiveling domain-containing protein